MKQQEALQIVSNVCAAFKGSLQEHTILQEAIKILKESININKIVKKDKAEVKEKNKK